MEAMDCSSVSDFCFELFNTSLMTLCREPQSRYRRIRSIVSLQLGFEIFSCSFHCLGGRIRTQSSCKRTTILASCAACLPSCPRHKLPGSSPRPVHPKFLLRRRLCALGHLSLVDVAVGDNARALLAFGHHRLWSFFEAPLPIATAPVPGCTPLGVVEASTIRTFHTQSSVHSQRLIQLR